MSGRYKVLVGSQSGHCCFDYTVVDTLKPHPVYASQGLFDAICETFSEEEAHAVARALNAAATSQATLARAARLFEEALPKFNWGASALDANAIQLLNEVPGEVRAALKACTLCGGEGHTAPNCPWAKEGGA
ncbi:hypothetical protein AN14_52 [Pseudomonas phage AN14]|uniref:CCHC-type domain-containing protein n=1 Tax=Pseudomonas phage AN14 TaxID=1868597 RepID=A0A1B0Z080_9CAUD|nr:hypothetical protein AN14_52 [Pseudomonas phage AN14]